MRLYMVRGRICGTLVDLSDICIIPQSSRSFPRTKELDQAAYRPAKHADLAMAMMVGRRMQRMSETLALAASPFPTSQHLGENVCASVDKALLQYFAPGNDGSWSWRADGQDCTVVGGWFEVTAWRE